MFGCLSILLKLEYLRGTILIKVYISLWIRHIVLHLFRFSQFQNFRMHPLFYPPFQEKLKISKRNRIDTGSY